MALQACGRMEKCVGDVECIVYCRRSVVGWEGVYERKGINKGGGGGRDASMILFRPA